MIGQTLGHYRIIEKIGAGGMGVVYRARDERLDREVALKLLPAGALTDESAHKRFRKEALALAKLSHPNVETLHELGIQGGVDFLVTEYVPGVTLSDKLALGPLSEREISRLGTQMAEGLTAAHEQGVVHRDLKPANLRITPDGRLKILDFGLAKLLRPAGEDVLTASVTETHAVAGTLPYMSPEQLQGELPDIRTDIYAAGAVLYEMAAGRRAFPETLPSRLTDAILHQPPVPLRAVNSRASPEVERITLKCLEKEPEKRYQSAKELGVDLHRLAAPSTSPAVPVEAPARTTWHWVGLASGLVLAAGLLVGLNVDGWRERLLGHVRPPHIESLAVLPLANLSGDPQQDYFADGMTEALIADLGQISALRVISRTSVMHYKGTRSTLPEIARELQVDAVVEGSIERAGNHVRVTAQLIYAPGDRHLWAKSYERDLRDVLVLEDDVAQAIANEIRVKLTPQEQVRLTSARPVNAEAHEAYLKGRYYWNRRPGGLAQGIKYFQEAIEKDPSYALAFSGLADSYGALATWELGTVPPSDAMVKANAAATRALNLDESLAEAHTSLAYVKLHYYWDWSETEKELRRAIELNPNYANAHHWYSHYLMTMGRIQESLAESRRALELDPLDPVMNGHLPWHYYYAHQYDQAIEQCRKMLETGASPFWAPFELGRAYEQKTMFKEAVAQLSKAVALQGNMTFALAALGHAYAVSGQRSQALEMLNQLKQMSKERYVSPSDIAMIYAGLGEKDQALTWLERGFSERSWYMVLLKVDPRLAPLRSDPRFQDLVRRVGLPQQASF